jgi:formylglycine-generating enzyme required for sulfatase activity
MRHLFRVRVATGSNRVLRGGSWGNNAWNCRAAYRIYNHPANRNANIGFRLASSLLRQKSIVYG